LRAYNARTRKKVIVIFDHGLPGGWSRELSTGPVKVVFAGSHTDADRVLVERVRAAKNAPGLVVVSSDRQVRQAAEARGAHVVSAEKFAADLLAPLPSRQVQRERGDDVHLSQSEVEEWMQMFRPTRRRKKRRSQSSK